MHLLGVGAVGLAAAVLVGAEVCCVALESLAVALLFLSAAAVVCAPASGGVGWGDVLPGR